MKKLGISSMLVLSAFSIALTFSPVKAIADPTILRLTGFNGGFADDALVYPYGFELTENGKTSPVSLMSLNIKDLVLPGESWDVSVTALSSSSSTADKEAAWLLYNAEQHPSDAGLDNWAVWEILDPGLKAPHGFFDFISQTAIGNQITAALDGEESESGSWFNGFDIYTPELPPHQYWWGLTGEPPSFIGGAPDTDPAPTPEPGSFMLLGTGLLAFAAVLYRRSRARVAGFSSLGA